MGNTVAKRTTVLVTPVETDIPTLTRGDFTRTLDAETFSTLLAETRQAEDKVTGSVGQAMDSIMWNKAALTFNAVKVSGLVGKDVPNGYTSLEDFGTRALGGASKAYVSRLRNAGQAVALHDVRRNSAAWGVISHYADKSGWAALIRDESEGATQRFRDAVKRFQETGEHPETSDGKGRKAQPNGKGKTSKTPDKTPVPVTVGDLLAAWANMLPVLHGLSDQDAEKFRGQIVKDLTSDTKRRETLAAKAAKDAEAKSPTPADMPKAKAS